MTKAFLFWLLMLIWLVLGFIWVWPSGPFTVAVYSHVGFNLFLFVLLALLGWQVFGKPVQ